MYDIDREHIGDLEYLGTLLADTRFSKGLSQRQVALYADISNTELYRLEKGERQKPSPKILKKLSEILNIPYEWLLQYAGYLDLQDDSISDNITINYNSLSLEEKDFILTYLCKKWNNESPDKAKKYTKEQIESILFNKNQIDEVLNEAMIGMSKEEYEKLSETQKKQIRDFALFVKNQDQIAKSEN